jgi:Carboxypeptidase regulatory-like domain
MLVTLRLALLLVVTASLGAVAQDAPVIVRGQVIAADNSATLPRARVTVLYSDPVLSSYTNDRGEFSIAAPRADSFTLSVVKAGYAEVRVTLQRAALTAAPARDVVMALTRSAAVNGLIVDSRGETVVGLSVYADRLDPDAETPAGLVNSQRPPTTAASTGSVGFRRENTRSRQQVRKTPAPS